MKPSFIILTTVAALTVFTGCGTASSSGSNSTSHSTVNSMPSADRASSSTTNAVSSNTVNSDLQKYEQQLQDSTAGNTLTQQQMIQIGEQTVKQDTKKFTLKNDADFQQWLNDTFDDPSQYASVRNGITFGQYSKVDVSFTNESVEHLGNNGLVYKAQVTLIGRDNNTGKIDSLVENAEYDIRFEDGRYKILFVHTDTVKES